MYMVYVIYMNGICDIHDVHGIHDIQDLVYSVHVSPKYEFTVAYSVYSPFTVTCPVNIMQYTARRGTSSCEWTIVLTGYCMRGDILSID